MQEAHYHIDCLSERIGELQQQNEELQKSIDWLSELHAAEYLTS